MQSMPSNEEIMADLAEAYRHTKEIAARLKNAFDKIEDEAILSGKAIPLTRLLQSALRAQIQLIGKIERYKKMMNSAPQPLREGAQKRSNGRVENAARLDLYPHSHSSVDYVASKPPKSAARAER